MPYSNDLPSALAPGAWTLTFDDEFDDPNAPLSVLDGGPFTNAFMTWGTTGRYLLISSRSFMLIRRLFPTLAVPIL